MVRADEDGRRPRRLAAKKLGDPGWIETVRGVGLRLVARRDQTPSASYVVLAVVVLALLEVPLAVSFARNERHDLTTKVERDAVAVGSLSEDVLERGVSAPPALEALGARYARDTGGRVVVVDTEGRSVVDSDGAIRGDFSTRPEIRTALGEPSPPAFVTRTRSAPTCCTSPSPSPRAVSSTARCGSRIRWPRSTRASTATG